MPPHPESEHLARALDRCGPHAITWEGIVYRSATSQYANREDLITGLGSRIDGGRWNPPSSFSVVYTSLDPHTTLDEALVHFRHYGVPEWEAMPRVIAAIEVRLRKVLDLTSSAPRRLLGLTLHIIRTEPWREQQERGQEALTQAIGCLTWEAEWEALLVPSAARRRGRNLIYFPANLSPPESWARIVNRRQLPRPG